MQMCIRDSRGRAEQHTHRPGVHGVYHRLPRLVGLALLKGTQFVFSDLGTYQPGDGWNVYSEIKRKLTEDYGIPPVSYTHLYQPIDESKINWQELEDRWGVKRDNLEKSGDLTKMLHLSLIHI